ncbi:MAG TPA: gephyrin-like molybdotransferase Glp [Capsulimonadaceae bacterium]|jgi:molybdopterin molybdotransferase
MLSYEDAISRILGSISPLDIVEQPLLNALGSIVASRVASRTDLPPFDNSQMDGYALLAANTANAYPDQPSHLKVIGEVPAGSIPSVTVAPGSAVRIFTGAAMPDGADAVVMVEDTKASDDKSTVDVFERATTGQYVRRAGEDARAGELVIDAGQVVTPGVIALAAAAGHATLPVHKRPRVAIISTGDELISPGGALALGQIFESNSYAVAAQVAEAGGECVAMLRAADNAESLRQALDDAAASAADVIVSSGGVSVGDYDLVKAVFGERGDVDFWRVAIRPGKPFAFGKHGDTLFFGLPGNPASAMVTFELFVRPALRALAGHAKPQRPLTTALLTEAVSHSRGRRSYLRAFATNTADSLMVTPLRHQGSHLLRPLAAANCLLIVPEDVDGIGAGDAAEVILYGELG